MSEGEEAEEAEREQERLDLRGGRIWDAGAGRGQGRDKAGAEIRERSAVLRAVQGERQGQDEESVEDRP